MRRQLTRRVCLYGNPTLDLVQDSFGSRWQYGGGVFYSSLPFIAHGFDVEIYSIVSHSIIDHPVFRFVKPVQYSNEYNIFYLKYDSTGSRTLMVIQSAPQLYDHYMHEGECITIVNPVLQEVSINLIKRLAVSSTNIAGDVQGFIRWKQGHSISLGLVPPVFEAFREIEILHMDVEEARVLTSENSYDAVINKLVSLSRGKVFVVTSGPGDVTVVSNEKALKIPHRGEVSRDATGAGDFFLGVLVLHLAVSNDLVESVFKSIEATEKWLEKRLHRHPPPG